MSCLPCARAKQLTEACALGHGEFVSDGEALIDEYIAHREKRCNEVLEKLTSAKGKLLSVQDITRQVYGEDLPAALMMPAMWNVQMALDVLEHELKVEKHQDSFRAKI